jgi:hypothetical protein
MSIDRGNEIKVVVGDNDGIQWKGEILKGALDSIRMGIMKDPSSEFRNMGVDAIH